MVCDRCGRNILKHEKFIKITINRAVTWRHEKCK